MAQLTDTIELSKAARISPRRAEEIIQSGRAIRFGNGIAVVGLENSLLIGEATRDVFLATPPLVEKFDEWGRFEAYLYSLEPAGRLRVHGNFDAEMMKQLGFHLALFYCEKEASASGGDVGTLEYRMATTALDRAFVRQCAALSVYQGMTAAYPGTPITPQRLTDYLDHELDFANGKASSIVAWQGEFPVAHATWVEHLDPVRGEPYVEMWDVDGLWDLRRSGILAQTATKAEHFIAASQRTSLMRGTVTIEEGWERIWVSLQGLGWRRTTDLWVKYPWTQASSEVIIDLRQPVLRAATTADLAEASRHYKDSGPQHLGELVEHGRLQRFGEHFLITHTEWSPMISGHTRLVFGLDDELIAHDEHWSAFTASLYEQQPVDRLWVWGLNDRTLMEARGFTHLVTEMGRTIEPGPPLPTPDGLLLKMMDTDEERNAVIRLMRQAVVNGMTATTGKTYHWDAPEIGEYVAGELHFDDKDNAPKALIGYEDGEIFGCAVWLTKREPVSGRPYEDVWDFYLKEGFFGRRLTRVFIEAAQSAVAAAAGGPVEIWANVVIDTEGGWTEVVAKLEHLGFSPKRHLFSVHPWKPGS